MTQQYLAAKYHDFLLVTSWVFVGRYTHISATRGGSGIKVVALNWRKLCVNRLRVVQEPSRKSCAEEKWSLYPAQKLFTKT